jgi:hypothetical protein
MGDFFHLDKPQLIYINSICRLMLQITEKSKLRSDIKRKLSENVRFHAHVSVDCIELIICFHSFSSPENSIKLFGCASKRFPLKHRRVSLNKIKSH